VIGSFPTVSLSDASVVDRVGRTGARTRGKVEGHSASPSGYSGWTRVYSHTLLTEHPPVTEQWAPDTLYIARWAFQVQRNL
jgi:hypothetical protein